jgi:uncharacterized protein (DUF305 family)
MWAKNYTLPAVMLVAGIIIGLGGFKVVDAKNHQTTSTTTSTMYGMGHDMSEKGMSAMSDELDGLSGDAFDKQFISTMIIHHQGAIDMANQAKSQAKHDEIKAMADDIIAAQTKEIDQMKAWQTQWGY